MDKGIGDASCAADFGRVARIRATGFKRGKEHTFAEILMAVLSLEERVFSVIALTQFAAAGGLDRSVRFPKHRADLGRDGVIDTPLTDGSLHDFHRLLHELPRIERRFRFHVTEVQMPIFFRIARKALSVSRASASMTASSWTISAMGRFVSASLVWM